MLTGARLSVPRIVLFLALLALLVAAREARPALVRVHDEIAKLGATPEHERELQPAFATDIDRAFLAEAARLLPADAVYLISVGEAVSVSAPVTLHAVTPFTRYWLQPRRDTAVAAEAEWVLSYGGDLDALGLRYARVVEVNRGIAIAEVAR